MGKDGSRKEKKEERGKALWLGYEISHSFLC